jgi:cytochrome c-type biogenesis protein CcmE
VTRRQRRLTLIGVALGVLGLALGMVLYAVRDTIVFFHPPSDVAARLVQPGMRFRLGGLVEAGSIRRSPGQVVDFEVRDAGAKIPVHYKGIVPDLFREGQGVVAEGVLRPTGVFEADTILARHDETYMPREVASALREQGLWQGDKPRHTSQR